ncbi:cell attachment protein [Plecomyxo virus]|nr:cell attachment protein [Plecomyxo virus]
MANQLQNKYFNTADQSIPEHKNIKINLNREKINSYGTFITSTISLVSIIVLLILNLTNLIKTYQDQGKPDMCKEYFQQVGTTVSSVAQDLESDIKPKVNLVASTASYLIPSMITTSETNIINEIVRTCSVDANQTSQECPQGLQLYHSPSFALINTDLVDACLDDGGSISLDNGTKFLNYPSFIPSATTPEGCIRIPSFSLTNTIFSYTHNVVYSGCADAGTSYQTWILGHIGTSYDNRPEPRATQTWDMGSIYNRKSCSTAAGLNYAWLVCAIITENERDDYKSEGIQQLSISYQSLQGTKKEWIYKEDDIEIDLKYAAIYPSVGSGVVVDGKVYFLLYGGLIENYPGNSLCQPKGCSSYTQQLCNEVDKPNWFYKRQIVNAILTFTDNADHKPLLKITTIPPSQNWIGAEGRLLYNKLTNDFIIYTRSNGWHTYLQIGILKIGPPITINWTPYTSIRRPGQKQCNATNICPDWCYSGVYADAFPLSSNLNLVISAVHDHILLRANPMIVSANPSFLTGIKHIYQGNHAAAYTSTTCFTFYDDIWCISIVEVPQSQSSDFVPIPFMYKLKVNCPKQTWWSSIKRNKYIKALTPYLMPRGHTLVTDDGLVTNSPPPTSPAATD